MRKTTKLWVASLAVLLLLGVGRVLAQENSVRPGPFYHLDFVVKELEGSKVINSRSYSTSIGKGGENSIRTGARLPIATGSFTDGGNGAVQTQFQYVDPGANFDCARAQEIDGKLALKVKAELSSVLLNDSAIQLKTQPTIRQNKWDADVIVSLGKPTTIFSSDDVFGKNKMQVELTATLIK